MENNKYESHSKSENIVIDDAQETITIKENFEEPKAKKVKIVTETMEFKNCESDDDPEITIIDDQEPIPTKENHKKSKTKKHKRKVKLGKDYNNEMETLYITQKLKVKKTKFSCIININNVGKKKRCPSPIIRPARNECKRHAYYNRIVPICMRKNCFPDDLCAKTCCGSVGNRYFYSASRERKCRFTRSGHSARYRHMTCQEEYRFKNAGRFCRDKKWSGLSPISSSSLVASDPISYEAVSDNSFSSEDELDTLIKRTKKREHQFIFPMNMKAYSEPFHSTNEDVASNYSGASLHSTSTMVLPPLETEAYSPSTSPNYVCNVSASYSPAFTPDLVIIENINEAIDPPYSPSDPTSTLFVNEDEHNEDYELKNVKVVPDSLAGPLRVKIEVDHENKNNARHIVDCMQNGTDVKKEINGSNGLIKIEDIKCQKESAREDYLNNAQIFETKMNVNNYIVVKSEKIKRENDNECDINDNVKVFVKVEKP